MTTVSTKHAPRHVGDPPMSILSGSTLVGVALFRINLIFQIVRYNSRVMDKGTQNIKTYKIKKKEKRKKRKETTFVPQILCTPLPVNGVLNLLRN